MHIIYSKFEILDFQTVHLIFDNRQSKSGPKHEFIKIKPNQS